MESTAVGQEVRRARLALGLTLAALSARTAELGRLVPIGTIHAIEHGDSRYPSEEILHPLGDALEPETNFHTLALLVYGITSSTPTPSPAAT